MRKIKYITFCIISLFLGLFISLLGLILIDKYIIEYLPEIKSKKNSPPLSLQSKPSAVNFSKTKLTTVPEVRSYAPEEFKKMLIPLGNGVSRRVYDPTTEARLEYDKWFYKDPILGMSKRANAKVRHQLISGDKFIFNVTYHSDAFGRRITPNKKNADTNFFLAFFGCSFTYGHGLQENETIPYYLAEKARDFIPYNYAVGGSAGHHALALMESRDLTKEIKQTSGIGIYLYQNDHMERITGNSYWSTNFPFAPYYHLDTNGKAKRAGTFETGRPVTTSFYRIVAESNFGKKFKIKLPLWISDEQLNTVCGVMEKMNEEFIRQFPTSKFYIGFLPNSNRDFDKLSVCLKNKKVEYLDLRNSYLGYKVPTIIPVDKHPNAYANQLVAHAIAELLNLK